MGKNSWIGLIGFNLVGIAAAFLAWPILIAATKWIRPTTSLPVWLNTFKNLGLVGAVICFSLGIVWYSLGTFVFKEATGGAKSAWWVIFIVALAAALAPGVFFLGAAQNQWLAFLLFGIDVVFAYWLGTALFSPDSVKYIPPFSIKLRR
jgi:hypothetical protein